MSVLRVSGPSFDVEGFLRSSELEPCQAFKVGEPRLETRPDGPRNTRSGFTVTVSDGAWTLRDQVRDACAFLARFEGELLALASRTDVDDMRLDFPVERRDASAQCEYFPPELVRAAGRIGIGLEITLYACAEEEDDAGETGPDGPPASRGGARGVSGGGA